MENWSLHSLAHAASEKHSENEAMALVSYADRLQSRRLPVLYTLNHLAKIVGVNHRFLHDTVDRRREVANYRMFRIKKRSSGYRFIHDVHEKLTKIHKFIDIEISKKIPVHPLAYAFHRQGGIYRCALKHCASRWLFQFDLKDFFYTIGENRVFEIFRQQGYDKLLSFEMARLCTTTRLPRMHWKYLKGPYRMDTGFPYRTYRNGVLPQGASSSPSISNLVARELDIELERFAKENGMVYTRYADDITLSCLEFSKHLSIGRVKNQVVHIIRKNGFLENDEKFRVAGPGSRKRVLGLLVDGPTPKLSKETRKRIERFLYAIDKFGWESVARHEKFDSAYGLHNHVSGLVAFVKDVDHNRWEDYIHRLNKIESKWRLA